MPRAALLAFLVLLGALLPAARGQAAQPGLPLVDRYLSEGKLGAGELALRGRLELQPGDEQARFGLGVLQFLQAVERLVQSFHRYGLMADQGAAFGLPILRVPTPPNDSPEAISYKDFRQIFQDFADALAEAEATLAQVGTAEVKLPLRFGLVRLDLNGDGRASDEELFWRLYTRYNRRAAMLEQSGELDADARAFVVALDGGDVHWLRGYSHLLMAMAEAYLAHDGRELFERTAHLFFPEVESPHTQLRGAGSEELMGFDPALIADVVTLIHLVSFDVAEPARMRAALTHLEAVIGQSRLSWQSISSETDDDREWLPNPRQRSVLPLANLQGGARPGVPARVDEDMVDGWLGFLDEAEAILRGDKLVPHWRVADGRGIDLRRVFTEPRPFDLILWLQGSAATPYLERGELTEGATWQELQRIFGGNFIGFALWIN